MGRIIINNRSSLPDERAAFYVWEIIERGRVSGDLYCIGTAFKNPEYGEIMVFARRNKKGTDTFSVRDAFILPDATEA